MTSLTPAGQEEVQTFYVSHHGWLQTWLRGRLGNACDAADLTHDTFLSVIKAGTLQEIREPRPFLATIAKRLLAHRYRRQLIERSYLEALAALPEETAPPPEKRLMVLEALQEIDSALDGLPLRVKQAFLLAHLEALTYQQIAERLNVSASSVKQYLSRANCQCLFRLAA
ncbi:sigma-70 family RNA polymerase sigma factor [Chitinasiproducens palmae]|uniref:RNA polymerase sigma-70 factor, ECF subfamily n=1 Tax=Chitinasiproducens palmae TaxID=1770053 RepID=A0A1H2PKB9_9BURK|nr:sigma-70 family RNA polymerase sigma factor [Chitinasiproducens palmae]SDV46891.1 RNA polymerase sigma-70 factor, ECF subfamily [Chitinasiproducens palmae]